MRLRRRLLAPASLALAAMLLLQAAIGFAPCELPQGAAGMQPGCHEPDQDPSLCVAHCATQDPTVTKAQFNVPDLGTHPAMPIRVAQQRTRPTLRHVAQAMAASGPPPRVLFQSFQL